jgi:uncharacterized membrane protein YdbT with pleckstrin-like domain
MSYIKSVLQPNEKIVVVGRLHWIVYYWAIWFLVVGIVLLLLEYEYWPEEWVVFSKERMIIGTAAGFGALTLAFAVYAWFIRWTTEIAVTDKRIIYKRGFITRHTAEMNMDKVASVDVDQSILGRILDYGSVDILGTGGAPGIEHLHRMASPIALRNAIEAR